MPFSFTFNLLCIIFSSRDLPFFLLILFELSNFPCRADLGPSCSFMEVALGLNGWNDPWRCWYCWIWLWRNDRGGVNLRFRKSPCYPFRSVHCIDKLPVLKQEGMFQQLKVTYLSYIICACFILISRRPTYLLGFDFNLLLHYLRMLTLRWLLLSLLIWIFLFKFTLENFLRS